MKKIIISLAPIAGSAKNTDVNILVNDIVESVKLGAGMVHLHVREKDGSLTKNLDVFEDTIKRIRKASDIVIQASTGGISNLTIEERCAALSLDLVEMSSLNGGSTNIGEFIYNNSFADIKYTANECFKNNILPEVEVFEIGMINNIIMISDEVKFRQPILFNIVLGHKGAMPASIKYLEAFQKFIPRNALWGITHYGRESDLSLISSAISMGASLVRIGFEDSDSLICGRKAASNSEIVKQLVERVRKMGFETATPKEVREILNIKH